MSELEARYTSPGAAFSAQARDEARLLELMERATVDLMLQVKKDAMSRNLTVGSTREAWARTVNKVVKDFGLSLDTPEGKTLVTSLSEIQLGDEAYSTASAVLSKAAETFPALPKKDIEAALDEALGLDTPSLTAAGAFRFISTLLQRMTRIGHPWRVRVKRAVRTGFTGMTGMLAMRALRAAGVPAKRWVSRHDDKTRDSHDRADGQTVDLESHFIVGGVPLLYPGDRSGPPHETMNCRCVIVAGRR